MRRDNGALGRFEEQFGDAYESKINQKLLSTKTPKDKPGIAEVRSFDKTNLKKTQEKKTLLTKEAIKQEKAKSS
ncbi:thymosin beta-12-like [Amphiprion ocellaris]|uniref:thymosin beta-12-like n=1 Tax=Amphiprion ocellaris TaxID=80972 RepID=UPI000C314B30|nr:thymosin beta-12-like [Amphiprion ocellaris]